MFCVFWVYLNLADCADGGSLVRQKIFAGYWVEIALVNWKVRSLLGENRSKVVEHFRETLRLFTNTGHENILFDLLAVHFTNKLKL